MFSDPQFLSVKCDEEIAVYSNGGGRTRKMLESTACPMSEKQVRARVQL